MADLTDNDIDSQYKSQVYIQDYSSKPKIEGVKIVELKNMVGEDGDFSEVVRLKENGELEQFPGFKLAQINRAKMLPNSIKAWHIHYKQDDIWYPTPSGSLFVGLWDLRENSPTKGQTMRIVLGGGSGNILFIPKGVAHGAKNITSKPIDLLYLIDKTFNIEDPDERRIHWDALGEDFWEAERD